MLNTIFKGADVLKKLLYITVNSKPENLSTSRTVGRVFVNKFVERYTEFTIEELDLYKGAYS